MLESYDSTIALGSNGNQALSQGYKVRFGTDWLDEYEGNEYSIDLGCIPFETFQEEEYLE